MSEDRIIVNSELSLTAAIAIMRRHFLEKKWTTYRFKFGENRSIDQNSLFHMWLAELIGFMLGKDRKSVSKAELAGIKRTMKKLYYQESAHKFMVHTITDYSTGMSKVDYTSSKSWSTPEMSGVLNWMQAHAAEMGLVLEAKGQFKALKNKSIG